MIDKTALWLGYIAMTIGGVAVLAMLAVGAFEACWRAVAWARDIGNLRYIMDAVDAYKKAGHYPPKGRHD